MYACGHLPHTHEAQQEGDQHGAQDEKQPHRVGRVVRVAVGGSDDNETDGIISNGEEQKELDGRVMKREDLGEGEGRGQGAGWG